VEAVAPQASARTGEHRTRLATLAKFAFTLTVLAALAGAGWAVIYSLSTEAPPARVGEAVGVPGGQLLVEKVTPEHMASMQMGKFAQAGMSGMSSMGMDMAPEGQRRFAVDVTLAAERGDLSYSPEDFRISGKGMNKEAGPIRSQLDAGTIAAGGAISGTLVFQAPQEASALMLSFGEEGPKVALDLKPDAQSNGHSHGGGHSQGLSQGEGHSGSHHHE